MSTYIILILKLKNNSQIRVVELEHQCSNSNLILFNKKVIYLKVLFEFIFLKIMNETKHDETIFDKYVKIYLHFIG